MDIAEGTLMNPVHTYIGKRHPDIFARLQLHVGFIFHVCFLIDHD